MKARTPEEIDSELMKWTLWHKDMRIKILTDWMNEIKASYEKNNLGDNQNIDTCSTDSICSSDNSDKLK